MIVVDASVLLASLVSSSGGGALAREQLRADPDLHVPHLADVEVFSALRRRVRLGLTAPDVAESALVALADFPAIRWDHAPLLGRMWQLRSNVSGYDAPYVALAEALDARLVTADGRLARAPGITCQVSVLAD